MSKVRFLLILVVELIGIAFLAEGRPLVRSLPQWQADSLARVQVFYRDRVVPFHTMAHDVTLKLTGNTKVADLDEVRFVSSLMMYPSDWSDIPLFKIKDKELADSLEIQKGNMIPLSNLFDEKHEYKLRKWYRGGDKGLDKAILDLDEKVEVILLLRTGCLYLPLAQTDLNPISESRVSLEIIYNKISVVRWLFMAIFCVAIIAVLFLYYKKGKFLWIIYLVLSGISIYNFVVRWILGGHIPLAGGEQVMMFVTMLLLVGSVIFSFKQPWIALGCLAMAGFTALVARISNSDPIVTVLSPALSSPWLAFHVSIIMASYAVFAIMLPLSLTSVFIKEEKAERMVKTVYLLNIIGVILLAAGIVLGSFWAKGAWGSYWSWDPKENWAALTLIAYLLPLCFKRYIFGHPRQYNLMLTGAFLFVIVTYYGVNYMSSLHSYGT